MLFGPCHARNLDFVACKQQRRRQVCTSLQSDLLLCYSLFGRYNNYSCYMRNFNILAGLWSCAGCFWTLPGRDPPDRFSYVESNFILLSFIMLICTGLLMSFPISSLCKNITPFFSFRTNYYYVISFWCTWWCYTTKYPAGSPFFITWEVLWCQAVILETFFSISPSPPW